MESFVFEKTEEEIETLFTFRKILIDERSHIERLKKTTGMNGAALNVII